MILLHLPARHTAEAVAEAMITEMGRLPDQLRRSVTWDQGSEMSGHAAITTATSMPIYFCDPHSPWQRGSNENTVSVGPGPVGLFSQAGVGSSR